MAYVLIIGGVLLARLIYLSYTFIFIDHSVIKTKVLPLELRLLRFATKPFLTEADKKRIEEIRERRKRGLSDF